MGKYFDPVLRNVEILLITFNKLITLHRGNRYCNTYHDRVVFDQSDKLFTYLSCNVRGRSNLEQSNCFSIV